MSKGKSILNTDLSDLFGRAGKKKPVPKKELAYFCRQMSFALDAGLPAVNAVELVSDGKGRLKSVRESLLRGESLSGELAAFGQAYPPLLISMFKIGEATATLPSVTARLADYYEAQSASEDELRSALVYPAMVACVMLAVILIAVTYVLPNYSAVFAASGAELPPLTSAVMGLSGFVASYGIFIPLAAAVFIFVFRFYIKSASGKLFFSRLALKMPVINDVVIKNANLHITQALGLLLGSGCPLVAALPMAAETADNAKVASDVKKMAAMITTGQSFWKLLSKINYIDPLFVSMARLGEETGNLPQTMEKCRVYFRREAETAVKRLCKLAEPIITLVLGLLLILVMLAVILPTFALTDAI
ncbi:MAG: type II secretion system F family protein [Defluviitaleaceae bacterium]|nr:type II secretion system F family protein [Defluviitaleaceae bacterium]